MDETKTATTESQETTDTARTSLLLSVALSRFLDVDGMDATIADDGQSVRVLKTGDSYQVSPDGVKSDGPYRSQLEVAVKKIRAATQATPE